MGEPLNAYVLQHRFHKLEKKMVELPIGTELTNSLEGS
jgi:hypothetical protein